MERLHHTIVNNVKHIIAQEFKITDLLKNSILSTEFYSCTGSAHEKSSPWSWMWKCVIQKSLQIQPNESYYIIAHIVFKNILIKWKQTNNSNVDTVLNIEKEHLHAPVHTRTPMWTHTHNDVQPLLHPAFRPPFSLISPNIFSDNEMWIVIVCSIPFVCMKTHNQSPFSLAILRYHSYV